MGFFKFGTIVLVSFIIAWFLVGLPTTQIKAKDKVVFHHSPYSVQFFSGGPHWSLQDKMNKFLSDNRTVKPISITVDGWDSSYPVVILLYERE